MRNFETKNPASQDLDFLAKFAQGVARLAEQREAGEGSQNSFCDVFKRKSTLFGIGGVLSLPLSEPLLGG